MQTGQQRIDMQFNRGFGNIHSQRNGVIGTAFAQMLQRFDLPRRQFIFFLEQFFSAGFVTVWQIFQYLRRQIRYAVQNQTQDIRIKSLRAFFADVPADAESKKTENVFCAV